MDISDFTPNGYKTFYWSNGNKRLEGNWVDGKKDGVFKYYNEDGTLNNTMEYSADMTQGESNRYYNGDKVMTYNYDSGSIVSSMEYLNNILVGEYSYSDAMIFIDPDAAEAPAVGTIFHSYDGKHPSEIYQGTIWTYVENSYELDINGQKVPVDIWLREPNGSGGGSGGGSYIYNGPFSEYRATTGKKLRTGSYSMIAELGKKNVSVLHGFDMLYRPSGNVMYKGEWDMGVKVNKVEFYDSKDRLWKSITLGEGSKYVDGFYNVMDTTINGKISYEFDSNTQAAHLTLQK